MVAVFLVEASKWVFDFAAWCARTLLCGNAYAEGATMPQTCQLRLCRVGTAALWPPHGIA